MKWNLAMARRLCWTVTAGVISAGGLLVLDAWWWLRGWQRALALSLWLTSMIVLMAWSAWVAVYPSETSHSMARRRQRRVNVLAVVAATLALTTWVGILLGWQEAPHYARRLFLPWSDALRPAPYRVVVTSGDMAAPGGERITVSAYIERLTPSTTWPPTVWLIRQVWPQGLPERLPMHLEEDGSAYASLTVENDFRYRIEVDTASSDWYRVIRIDPVGLSRESLLVVEPPSYAAHLPTRQYAFPEGDTPTLLRVRAWQYGVVQIQVNFTRPVATAYLEWRAEEESTVEIFPLLLDGEHRLGMVRWSVARSGRWKLVAVLERQGRRWLCQWPGTVEVQPDMPPRWLEVTGLLAIPRRIAPGSTLPIRFRAQDDFGIAQVFLEYSRESNPWSHQISLPFVTHADGSVEGHYDWQIDKHIPEGEIVRLRLRVRDNRRMEHPGQGQQEVVFPPDGWCELRVDAAASPLAVQDIQVQHAWLRDAGHALRKQCQTSRQTLLLVYREASSTWQDHHRTLLRQVTEQWREVRRAWDHICLQIRLLPDLHPLAAAAHLIQEEEDQFVRTAERWTYLLTAAEQRESLRHALERLQILEQHLHDFEKLNDLWAEARQQSEQLMQLAQRLEALVQQMESTDRPEERARLRLLRKSWHQDWHHWLEGTPAIRIVWEHQVAQELQRLQRHGLELLTALERSAEADAAAFQAARHLFLQSQTTWIRSLLQSAGTLERQRAGHPFLETLEAARLELWGQTLNFLERGDWLSALTVLEQVADEAERQARQLKEPAPELSQQWRELARRCRTQRSFLAAQQQQVLAYLTVPAQEPLPMLVRRAERCAEAAAHVLEPYHLSLAFKPAVVEWFLHDLRAAVHHLQTGQWQDAVTALHHAREGLLLFQAGIQDTIPVVLSLQSLQEELRALTRLVQRYRDSPALTLTQCRWSVHQYLRQLQHWYEQWRSLVASTPSHLLSPSSLPSSGDSQRWLQAWRELDRTLAQGKPQGLTGPLATLPAYQAACRSCREALDALAARIPKAQAEVSGDDPTLLPTVEKLRQAHVLLSDLASDSYDDQAGVAQLRRLAQLLREAATQRRAFPAGEKGLFPRSALIPQERPVP